MTEECKKVQQLGKGISSPTRYKIIETLISGPKTVTELVVKVKLSQPAVSQHLATLKSCGLVVSLKNGQEVMYSLNVRNMLDIITTLSKDIKKCKNP